MSLNAPVGVTQGGSFELAREPLGARASRSRIASLALGGLLLSTTVLVLCAAHTNALLPESVRPVPSWLAGVFANAGPSLGSAGLAVVLVFMFGAYAIAATRAEQYSARTVLGCIAALHALVLLAPPLLSTDVFSYQAYARMFSNYGVNPFVHGPNVIALDPVYPYIDAKWVSIPTAYGPIFTALSAVLAPLSIAAGVIAYKGLAALASLVIVALVWNIARLRGLDPVKAAALVGLNPLVVVYGVGGGHNDFLMVAVLLAGVSFVVQGRDRAAGASFVTAAGIKLTGGLVGIFAIAGVAQRHLRRRELLTGGAVAAGSVAALAFGLFGTGSLHLLDTLRQSQSQGDWHSIPGLISTRLGFGTIGHLTGYLLGVGFAASVIWLLRRVWRGQIDWIDGAAWATVVMLATASSLLPWYVVWLMPLAALARDPRLVKTALWLCAIVQVIAILGYIPHGHSLAGL